MKGLLLRNQVFPLQTVWIQKGPKTWFLTITILLALALLPAPSLAPPAPQSWGETGATPHPWGERGATPQPWGERGATPQGWGERGAAAQQDPTVRIDPAESVLGASQTFTASVMIDQADDLGGFEFTLLFITKTVTVDSVAVGDFPGSTGREVIPAVGPTIDNQAGQVSLGVVTVGSASGPSGTGALATVTLTTQDAGQSPLDLQDVVVLDTHAQRKTPIVEDGVVRVGFAIYLPLILKDW